MFLESGHLKKNSIEIGEKERKESITTLGNQINVHTLRGYTNSRPIFDYR